MCISFYAYTKYLTACVPYSAYVEYEYAENINKEGQINLEIYS